LSTFSEVSCGFAESETKGNHEGSASGQDNCFPTMLSKDGASLLLRVRLDKLKLRRLHFILLVLLLPQDICLDFFHVIVKFSSYNHIREINIFCQDNILWKYFTNDNKMIPNILKFDLDII